MRENVARALGAREQVLAVIGIEEFSQCLDAADDHQEIVLALQREHGVDEIVAGTLLAELDFQAVGEESEKITQSLRSLFEWSDQKLSASSVRVDFP